MTVRGRGVADDRQQNGKIKVTDKRMFTADGELREDFQHLEDSPSTETSPPRSPEPEPSDPTEPESADSPHAAGSEDSGARVEMPHTPGSIGTPGFLDLVSALAEPITLYLGDAQLPDGGSAENLDAARFYIDLLEVLHSKTAGNLSVQEATVLENLLYQLRMRYVDKQK